MFAFAIVGTLLTGLYTFRLVFRVFHGDPAPFVEETYDEHHGEGPRVMLIPVGVLAVGSILVGWLQVPGGWQAVSDWLDPVVPPLVDPSNTQEAVASIVSVALGLRRHRRRMVDLRRAAPAGAAPPRRRSSTSSGSTSSTTPSSTSRRWRRRRRSTRSSRARSSAAR